MEAKKTQLSKLVDMENFQSVVDEIKTIVFMIFPEFGFGPVNRVFGDGAKLFRGEYPGYRKCNTQYHDFKHTTDALLAMTRLIHGATLQRESFSQKNITLGLISTLFHDTGYIQTVDDDSGTGGKYTLVHVQRSIEFMDKYFKKNNFPREDFENCRDMLECTGLSIDISKIQFKSREIELLGKMLGTADLLGQMSDNAYLKKLTFLFNEFKEGNVVGYPSELDLLKETPAFYDKTKNRFATELGGVNRYMIYHFKKRWNIDRDLYAEAVEMNMNSLEFILANHEEEYRDYLISCSG